MIRAPRAILLLILVAMVACHEEPRVARSSTAPQPKWLQEDVRKVEISPELKKLAEQKDPDLDRQLTQAEIKAALEAAHQKTPAAAPATVTAPTGSGEWAKLEAEQRAAREVYEQRLQATTVYVAPGSSTYHTAGCSALYVNNFDQFGVLRRVYTGSAITLAAAKARGLGRHPDCGPPSYDR